MRADIRQSGLLSTLGSFLREKRVGRDDTRVVVDTDKLKTELKGMSRGEKVQLKQSLEQSLQAEGVSGAWRINREDEFDADPTRLQREAMLKLVLEQLAQMPPSRGPAGGGKPPAQSNPGDVVVSQLNPEGAKEAGYRNGHVKCGAAAVATLARGFGMFNNMSDAELVDGLAGGQTGQQGTSGVGIMQMLREARLPLAGPPYVGSFDPSALREHLRGGNKLVAQVGLRDPKTGKTSGHFVTISDRRGPNFVVQDPLSGKTQVWTPQQLQRAVRDAPGVGMVIPVGPPSPQALQSRRLAETPAFVPKDQTVGQYARWVGEMIQSSHPGHMARGAVLYQSLLQSNNPRDQRAAQLIHKGVVQHIDRARGPARTLANDVLRQMQSSDQAERNAGTARYQRLLHSQDPQEQRAARIIFRHVMINEPGGGFNRRGVSVGTM